MATVPATDKHFINHCAIFRIPRPIRSLAAPLTIAQIQASIIEVDNCAHQPIHANRHDDGDARQNEHLSQERAGLNGTQGNGNNLRRDNEIRTHGTPDFCLFNRHQVQRRSCRRAGQYQRQEAASHARAFFSMSPENKSGNASRRYCAAHEKDRLTAVFFRCL
jgi:hypothetical protein